MKSKTYWVISAVILFVVAVLVTAPQKEEKTFAILASPEATRNWNEYLSHTPDPAYVAKIRALGYQPVQYVQDAQGVWNEQIVCHGGYGGKYIGAVPCLENSGMNNLGTFVVSVNTTPMSATSSFTPTNTATRMPTNTSTATQTKTSIPTITPTPTANYQSIIVTIAYRGVDANRSTKLLNVRSKPSMSNATKGYLVPYSTWEVVEVASSNGKDYWGRIGRDAWIPLYYMGVYYTSWRLY